MAKPQDQWPDEHGQNRNINSLANEKLLADTQRLVDAHRRHEDDRLYANVTDASEYDPEVSHKCTQPLVFEGLLGQMVKECEKRRGLELNTDR